VVAVTAVVKTGKDPEELPAGTLRVAGTPTAVLLLESATTAPLGGAAADSVTVHVLIAPPTTVAGVQLKDDVVIAGGFTASEALEEVPP
jgi:hypothetical protein